MGFTYQTAWRDLEIVVALAVPRFRFRELRRSGRRMAFRLDGFQGPSEERRG